jgi:predicted RNase H-like HicB family nuclease
MMVAVWGAGGRWGRLWIGLKIRFRWINFWREATTKRRERIFMRTVKIVYWQEDDGRWLGHLETYPEFMSQGETLDELRENLRDILAEVESRNIPLVKTHEDMAV